GELGLGLEPAAPRMGLFDEPEVLALFGEPDCSVRERDPVAPPGVVETSSRILYGVLAVGYSGLGFDALGDVVFRDLVIARVVEPTSILDTGRVLRDPGVRAASEKTIRRSWPGRGR